MADKPSTVDEYINSFPEDVRVVLEKVRDTIRATAPTSEETISYDIPAFNLNGRYLVYFAGWKNHVAVYPVPTGDEAFQSAIAPYRKGKGTLQFPYKKPIPYDLITQAVELLGAGT